MKIIVAPDKFKGSLTSMQACECIRDGILQAGKNAEVHVFPMADGGDGFAAVIKYYLQTKTVQCKTVDPLNRDIPASYEWDEPNKMAVIELATASGLVLLKEEERDPLQTSTYGTGILIQHAVNNGAKKIIMGLGGSATNDAGMGILAALGFIFKDENGKILSPAGNSLPLIQSIIKPSSLPSVQLTLACDVTNVLFGKQGAAFVYAPQKGANDNTVKILDEGLKHFAGLIRSQTGKDIAGFAGAGAAGGVAAGLSAYFNVQVASGANLVTATSGIGKYLKDADLIITGEGRLDEQTGKGKVVHHITATANKYKIPVIAVCGEVCITHTAVKEMGLYDAIGLINKNVSKNEAMKNTAALLQSAAASLTEQFLENDKF